MPTPGLSMGDRHPARRWIANRLAPIAAVLLLLCTASCGPWYVRANRLEWVAVGGTPTALETLTRELQHPGSGVIVRLVGVVHFGSPGYYRKLEALLQAQPLVLFELIGDPDAAAGTDWIRAADLQLKYLNTLLGTVSQVRALEHLYAPAEPDTGPSRWRHADMTMAELVTAFARRGVDLPADWDIDRRLQEILTRSLELQVVLPQDLQRAFAVEALLDTLAHRPIDLGSWLAESYEILIEERNDVVLAELEGLLADSSVRSVTVFYGAGHMPDLEARICARFGFQVREDRDRWDRVAVVDALTSYQIEDQIRGMLDRLRWTRQLMRAPMLGDLQVLLEMRAGIREVESALERVSAAVRSRHQAEVRRLRGLVEFLIELLEQEIPAGERRHLPAGAALEDRDDGECGAGLARTS